MSAVTPEQVVEAARGWLETPFHHQARLKGVGVDCIGLVIGVARELGLVAPDFDITAYSRMPDGNSLMAYANWHLTQVEFEELAPGHILVLAIDQEPQHFGVVGDYRHGGLSLVHAHSPSQRVIETRLMFTGNLRYVQAFAFPGVA